MTEPFDPAAAARLAPRAAMELLAWLSPRVSGDEQALVAYYIAVLMLANVARDWARLQSPNVAAFVEREAEAGAMVLLQARGKMEETEPLPMGDVSQSWGTHADLRDCIRSLASEVRS